MSQRAVSILFVVTALLLGYVFLFERGSVTSKELEQRKGRVLQTFVRDRVQRLEIEARGKTVLLERKPEESAGFASWRMLKPVEGDADEAAVDQVLGELEWLSPRRTFEEPSAEDEKAFGLDKPRYKLWFTVAGKRYALAVGSDDAHGQGVYVRTENTKRAFVVPKTLTEALDHGPGRYRSKEFLGNIVLAWVRSVELESEGEKLRLTREGDKWLYAGKPPDSFADSVSIDRLLTSLDDLRAVRFLDEEPALAEAKAALSQPVASVRVRVVPDAQREDQTPKFFDLRIGGACPGHVDELLAQAGEKGDVVCAKQADLAPFTPDHESLRQRKLTGYEPSRVEGFELAAGPRKLSLKRDGENWIAVGGVNPDRSAVESWLRDVFALQATAFSELVEPAHETARLVLTLTGGKKDAFVAFGLTPDNKLRVRRGEEPAVVLFPSALADLLEPSATRFQSLEPWATRKPSEVIAVEAKAESFARALALGEGGWGVQGKALPASDEFRTRELVKLLLKTYALAFVTEQARPEHGLVSPQGAVTFTLQAADKKQVSLRLEVGAETPRGRYARFDGGAVFEVEPRVFGEILELAGGPPVSATVAPAAQPSDHDDHEGHGHGDHDHQH